MTRLYSSSAVRELDRIAIEERGIPGIVLMRRAAEACVEVLMETWPDPGVVAVLCGSGNNAGDGFIIAGLLASRGVEVSVGMVGKIPQSGTDAATARSFCLENLVSIHSPNEALEGADLVVDAMLGTGISGDVRAGYREVIEKVNDSGLPVLAVDIPSGLCADTGSILGSVICADATVSFIGLKVGLMTNNGPEYCGELHFDDLDVPGDVLDSASAEAELLEYASLSQRLPVRHRNAHKVSHGHLLVIGGDEGMAGAASLASEAGLYAGAGMVSVATRPDNVAALVARRPEVMARGVTSREELKPLLERATFLVVGPGLGRSEWSRELFAAALESGLPALVDADGLNLLAESPEKREGWVLTPHPGEASRLLGHEVQDDRLASVRELLSKYGGVSLLKGSGTVIASDGRLSLCPYGNPGMSVAGMGDLLSGIIGALAAQGMSLVDATELGAAVHAIAADNWVEAHGERGLLATDLLQEVRSLLNP